MGGCCQANSGKNERTFEENQGLSSNADNDNTLSHARGGQNYYAPNSNSKSFLDVNNNLNSQRIQTFLSPEINVIEASKENIEIVPEEYRHLVKQKSLIFLFNASVEEIIMPIWIFEGTKVKINVIGHWNIFENENYFDCCGIKDIDIENSPFNLPVGSLCGYVQGGEVFSVQNETDYVSQISGPLVLFQNNGEYDVKPNGTLLIIIEGAVKYSMEEMEVNLGWNQEILENVNSITFMSNEEKHILYYLNKLRYNPQLFAKLYLSHRIHYNKSDEECFNHLMSLKPIPLLKASVDLYRAAKYHAFDMSQNNMTGHISSNGKNLKERLDGLKLDINKIGENCSYGISNPLAIVLELLVDETDSKGHRRNLLDSQFELAGISLETHPYWGISCVQDFSKSMED